MLPIRKTLAAAALDEEKSQVDAKQQEVADAQKKVDDLQAKLNAPSGDAAANNPQRYSLWALTPNQ